MLRRVHHYLQTPKLLHEAASILLYRNWMEGNQFSGIFGCASGVEVDDISGVNLADIPAIKIRRLTSYIGTTLKRQCR